MTVYMPDTDYKSICDATREKCGTTGLLKSYEIKPLLAALETGGAKFTLTVNVDSGSAVVATKGSLSVSGTATNGVCVLELPEAGEWTVTASLDGQSASGVVNVKGDYPEDLRLYPEIGTPLNDVSWEMISRVAKKGLANQYFSVGDRKKVVLNGTVGTCTFENYETYVSIIGINHNAALEGENLIHFQFAHDALSGGNSIAFVDGSYGGQTLANGRFTFGNTSGAYAKGGWEASQLRNVICGTSLQSYTGTMIGALPDDLRDVLAPVIKYTNNKTRSSTEDTVTPTIDYIFVPAVYEVLGKMSDANAYEKNYQQQYAYYSAGNSTVKLRHTTLGEAYWWTRSLKVDNSDSNAIYISTSNGSAYNTQGAMSYGFAPCFCVGGA